MKKIPLSQGKFTLVDDEDYEILSQWKWSAACPNPKKAIKKWYAVRDTKMIKRKRGKRIYMHRFLMNPPDGYEVDHEDGDGLNNQKYNLRICTHAENVRNKQIPSNNSSGYKGVYWDKGVKKWRAQIVDRKLKTTRYIGIFDDPVDAAKAYDREAKKLFGKFANLNF